MVLTDIGVLVFDGHVVRGRSCAHGLGRLFFAPGSGFVTCMVYVN